MRKIGECKGTNDNLIFFTVGIVKGIHMNFIEIQSFDQIPAVAYFCSCFSSSFNLPSFDIEDLEEALLLESSENNSIDDSTAAELAPRLIPELIVSLLQGCNLAKSWPSITTSNYQLFLRRLFRQKCEEYFIENPFPLDTDFHNFSLHTKVIILNYLCDFRLDSANVEVILSQYEADSLRIEPLGYDANGSIYWYFFGTRLYREDIPKSKKSQNEKVWQVICFTEQDWQNLTKKFQNSKSRKEVALYKILVENFLPSIPVLFKSKEAERRRRLFQRRSSLRVKKIANRQKDQATLNSFLLSRRFQRRSLLRFEKIANRQKDQDEDELALLSEDESDNKLSHTEKYLEHRKKQLSEQRKIREDLQNKRALRAQRRSSSFSSTSSQTSSCDRKSSFNLSFDSVVEEQFIKNPENCLSNKENILFSALEFVKRKQNLTEKMPPTSTKLPGRQTNNSLSSVTGQIVIEPPATASKSSPGPSTSRKKKVKAEVTITSANLMPPISFLETDEVLQIGMHKVLQTVKNHDDAWPFMDPVEEDIAPRYYSIIKRPMDLLKMDEKLENGEYRTFPEFRTDFKLIVNNCRLYNGQSNEYTEMVNNLQVAFDRATKKYFDQSSSDEDPVLLEYPPIEPTVSRLNLSKEKEAKKEKLKAKDKKHVKQHVPSSDESNNDEENGLKSHHKKFKELKHKDDKKGSHSSDKKKERSTRGVKRKHKDKDKNDKPKSKKIKKDYTDDENEKFEFDTDQSGSEDDKVSDTKKVKNVKSNEVVKTEKKVKKSENSKQVNSKKKVKSSVTEKDDFAGEKLKKIKKSEKFSKTNEKANNKKRKLEDDSKKNSDSDSNESVQDLITEKKIPVTSKNDTKKIKSKGSEDVHKKLPTPSSTPKKSEKVSLPSKSKKNIKKSSNNEDLFSMSSGSFSRSPSPLPSIRSSALTEDMANSLDCENDTSKGSKKILDSSFRSDTPEIKDKFDLIKERRNKMSQEKEKARRKDQPQAISQTKEKNHKLKETIEKLKIKNEKSKSQIELMDEVLGGKSVKKETSIFDKLKNEETSPKVKGSKKKNESVEGADVPVKSKKIKVEKSEKSEAKLISKKQKGAEKVAANNPNINSKNKKQNKACLDVLDMETEQTLKDINKWLEHTPRFEYSSASNSPSRYMIDEIDMPSKMDDNDFRKPIPLMPSSPSASHSNFQSPTNAPKDFNLLKESNNNKQTALSQNSSTASTSNKKVGSKEPKRKSLKEKLQQLPRKKEVQRTIDRLQPGKTKGNLLHNIQNINKPEELFPLGNREKPKEIKNSLIVQTDESSPKLSLGTVLDTQAFNFNDNDGKKQETDCYEEISLKVDEENDDIKDSENGQLKNEETGETSSDDKKDCKETFKDNETKSAEQNASKPNLNAWFKAFGVPKKPKKSESQDESGKLSDNTDSLKTEGNYLPTPRRLSTGSSISERSSESSPQVGLEERLGAPAPYPSPIGPAPIMVSPKTDEAQKATASNFPNGSLRVGFYQDMTSTKSSPEKSCSPREMPSPYGQYSQQHLYSGASASASPGMYGNFYNPDNNSSGKQAQQASYSKPTNSPASYYDQYKQPLSQESDFNNSMSPSTNPNSPYHSQQTSPYQQQPTSPFQSPSGGTANNSVGNTSSISQAPNSPYSQPNSPYQQPQPQQPIATTFHQSSTTSSASQQHETNPQVQTPAFNNQSGNFSQIGQNASFNAHHRNPEQFSTTAAQPNCPKPSDWNKPNVNAYNLNASQTPNNFNVSSQQPQPTSQNQNPQNSVQHHSQHILTPESTFAQSQGNYNKKPSNEPQSSGTPTTTPLYGTSKLPDHGTGYGGLDMVTKTLGNASKEMIPIAATNKPIEGSKYLDLSKQQTAHINQHPQSSQTQYQQMFDLSNYTKASQEFDMSKSKALDMYNRTMSKNNAAITTPCATGSGFWGNANNKPVEAPANYGTNHVETNKIDLSNKTNSIAGSNFLNNSVPHQQPARTTPSIDINYKQPMFNNPAASSMMDLTAFMRDFRQAEERFSSLSGGPSSFYDKNITPHMFGKNLQPTNSSVALQQMFNNSMTTMAYNREQQNMNLPNYHNRLSSSVQGAVPNANQSSHVSNPQATEAKTKKQRKKKNASPDVAANTHQMQSQNPIQQHHQSQSHQHSQHQQQLAHQQSFQSYGGLKIPAASGPTTDPSAISLKSVVPGSAFNYGPTLSGLYGENPAYLDDFRGTPNPYYPPPPGLGHRSTPDPVIDKTATNPPPAHPQASSSPYHHLLPPHHPSRSSYPFMNSIDPATLQQQYRMMLNQTYQAGYHPALGMQNHWPPHHM